MPINRKEILWYPMRVTYGREMRVKAFLDSIDVESFLPMTNKVSKVVGRIRHETVPAISNLIFVHSSLSIINELKHTRQDAEPLRYMTRPITVDKALKNEIIVVPDKQMDNFIKVASGSDDERTFLSTSDLRGHAGDKVLITNGPFKGVEGVIKRIKGNRRVVVEIAGIAGVCINFVPKSFMISSKNGGKQSTTTV